jgi:hypothetical protein
VVELSTGPAPPLPVMVDVPPLPPPLPLPPVPDEPGEALLAEQATSVRKAHNNQLDRRMSFL